MQPISQKTHDLNSELLVCYSSFNLNNKPYDEQTIFDHSNTELVRYSDPIVLQSIKPLNVHYIKSY